MRTTITLDPDAYEAARTISSATGRRHGLRLATFDRRLSSLAPDPRDVETIPVAG